jgi:hypothetical protein
MLCFDVRVNGESVAMAGVGESGVMHAIVGWVSREGRPDDERPDLELRVGGLVADAHLEWVERPLQVGDRVEVIVVEGEPSPATREKRDDKALIEESERKTYQRLKRKYDAKG